MASSWLLQAIYTALLGQAALGPSQPPPSTGSTVATGTGNSNTGSSYVYVTTRSAYGELRGVRQMTATNVLVDSFLGIPFASPPVGPRRFARPEPPLKWSGVRDATKFGYECHQRGNPEEMYQVAAMAVERSEDCLHLNVYVPAGGAGDGDGTTAKTSQGLAVMVFIHGGSYYLGAGSHYDGNELAATGVIVVTVNYRLDVFGFMSNEGDEIPGNFGMLDQIMALRWVRENIGFFGGDPSKVTIFGESAGSGSVSLLVLSPLASGLFSRAIMESGVSMAPWAFISPALKLKPRTMYSLIGNKVGCVESDASKNLQCLRSIDSEILMNASVAVQETLGTYQIHSPRVENTFSFLPDLPVNLLSKNRFNHVDTIHGFNVDESGTYYLDEENDGISKDEFFQFIKSGLDPYAITNRDSLINEIVSLYTGNLKDPKAIRYAAVRARSDFQFDAPTLIEAKIQSRLAPERSHFVYKFQYKPSFSTNPSWLNATHAEELPFVFGVNLPQFRKFSNGNLPNREDNIVWNQMKALWSNFAKYGNPTKTVPAGAIDWTPYDAKTAKYLQIDTASQLLSYTDTKATSIFEKLLPIVQTTVSFDAVVGRK